MYYLMLILGGSRYYREFKNLGDACFYKTVFRTTLSRRNNEVFIRKKLYSSEYGFFCVRLTDDDLKHFVRNFTLAI